MEKTKKNGYSTHKVVLWDSRNGKFSNPTIKIRKNHPDYEDDFSDLKDLVCLSDRKFMELVKPQVIGTLIKKMLFDLPFQVVGYTDDSGLYTQDKLNIPYGLEFRESPESEEYDYLSSNVVFLSVRKVTHDGIWVYGNLYLNDPIFVEKVVKKHRVNPKTESEVLRDFYKHHEPIVEVPIPKVLKSIKPNNTVKVGRNEPCPCGSGKKYKKCCLNQFSKVS